MVKTTATACLLEVSQINVKFSIEFYFPAKHVMIIHSHFILFRTRLVVWLEQNIFLNR